MIEKNIWTTIKVLKRISACQGNDYVACDSTVGPSMILGTSNLHGHQNFISIQCYTWPTLTKCLSCDCLDLLLAYEFFYDARD